jgi:hypothetical protein
VASNSTVHKLAIMRRRRLASNKNKKMEERLLRDSA